VPQGPALAGARRAADNSDLDFERVPRRARSTTSSKPSSSRRCSTWPEHRGSATDALIALRRGYRTVTLASVDLTGFPANDHWPSDTPENLRWDTIRDAIAVSEQFIHRQRP
jgi:hypothetical protein